MWPGGLHASAGCVPAIPYGGNGGMANVNRGRFTLALHKRQMYMRCPLKALLVTLARFQKAGQSRAGEPKHSNSSE